MSGSLCFQRIVVWGEPKSTARFHLAPINGAAVQKPPLRLLSRERPFIGGSPSVVLPIADKNPPGACRWYC